MSNCGQTEIVLDPWLEIFEQDLKSIRQANPDYQSSNELLLEDVITRAVDLAVAALAADDQGLA